MNRRIAPLAAAVLVVAVLAAAGFLLLGGRHDSATPAGAAGRALPPPSPALRGSAPASEPSGPAPGEAAAHDPLEALLVAAASRDADAARAAAAALRRRVRTDPGSLERALTRLLDPALSSEQRGALAFVLGTIEAPGVDAGLIAALRRFDDDPRLEAWLLLALGAQRDPPDDDDVFDLGDRPFGVAGPAGLGITVRRRIEDPTTRAALLSCLGRDEADMRRAAATALGETMEEGDVRAAFRTTLAAEREDGVAAALATPLARWAASGDRGREGDDVLRALVARAPSEGFDTYRFRLEDALSRSSLPADVRDALLGLTQSDRTFDVRSFALSVLAANAEGKGRASAGLVAERFDALLASDPSAAIRDRAAQGLGRTPWSSGSERALERALARDEAWNVRFAAVTSLGRFGARPSVREALERATSDEDPRVAKHAREALARLGDR